MGKFGFVGETELVFCRERRPRRSTHLHTNQTFKFGFIGELQTKI